MRNFLFVLALASIASCSKTANDFDTFNGTLDFDQPIQVFTAEKVYTGNPTAPVAGGLVVGNDGRILAMLPEGFDGSVNSPSGTLTTHTTRGTMYPGLVDSHVHLLGIGQRELMFNLEGTASIAELVARLRTELEGRETGRTLYGRGWIETGWPEGRMPNAADLDAVSPDHPVILERADGHAVVANTAALVAGGITNDTPDPEGGKIERSADGKATGLLIDYAAAPVMALIAEPTYADIVEAYEVGAKLYASRGWTGVHNMSVPPQHAALLERLDKQGKLPIRIHNAFDLGENEVGMQLAASRAHETDTITNRGVKLYMDGALGSRGAQLLQPYADRPESSGLSLLADEALTTLMKTAETKGVQLAIHAIGDKANRRVIEAFENGGYSRDLRWRIEHTQILAAEDVARMGQSGLIASMQPSHAIGDLFFAPDRLGSNRLTGAYAWRGILDAGGVIVGGSDAPVEVGSPLIEFYAAVARKSLDGFSNEDWHPEQAVSREEALSLFTHGPAYASFQEDHIGTLEIGKLADFTVFDRDLMTIPDADILEAGVVMTVVGGEVVYAAD